MRIVGPKTKLTHVKRIVGTETAAGTPITWDTPIRFEGIMALLTGREVFIYQQMNVVVKYKIWTNYLDIVEKDRVVRDSITYNVELVDPALMTNKIAVVLLDVKKE